MTKETEKIVVRCLLISITLAVVIGSIVLYMYLSLFTAKLAVWSDPGEVEYLITDVPTTIWSNKRC